MLSLRLPTEHIARLLLALLLICNLTICVTWQGIDDDAMGFPAIAEQSVATQDSAMSSCHDMTSDNSQAGCHMQGGITSLGGAGLPVLAELLILFALPLLLPRSGATASVRELWLRDPFLREHGTHPQSWPRRHLMLSVLLH